MRRFVLIVAAVAFLAAITLGAARSSAPSDMPLARPVKPSIEEVMRQQDGAIDFLLDRIEGKNSHVYVAR